ncbi:CGNR zinc finger domain-containing protein [Corticibacterium sp. UT-5YL-CI-8]|nr:CGNR zinc finger domain-containing protein [Tianweitania sp. UT-5YL-CI-8]
MAIEWNAHRFSGGVLALDVANTVVLRGDAERGFDRFSDVSEIGRFADAASIVRAEELRGRMLDASDAQRIAPLVIALREATDRLFRDAVGQGGFAADRTASVLRCCSEALSNSGERIGAPSPGAIAFEAALAISALSLLREEMLPKLKICANCRWLFVDRSRNGSRLWCDMTVCGNRSKARRHYRRHRAREDADHG